MENGVTHIKNFFLFLEKKENRKIPIKIKLEYFKDGLSNEEINELPVYLKYQYFPNKIDKKDTYRIMHDDSYQNHKLRANIYNKNLKNKKFEYIFPFDVYGPNIAFSIKSGHDYKNDGVFINKNGDPDIRGIDPELIKDFFFLRSYLNQSQNKIKIKSRDTFSLFGKYSPSVIFYADHTDPENRWFINKDGEKDISGVNPKKLNTDRERAAYCNTLLKTPMFYHVSIFDEIAPDIAYAVPLEGYSMFINIHGKPDIKGIDPNAIKNNTKYSNAYSNTIKILSLPFELNNNS